MARDRAPPTTSAPWFKVPENTVLCIEHPAKVVNVDRAMETLGGIDAVTKSCNGDGELSLRWRPEDITAPPIEGKNVPSTAVLLKITVPKKQAGKTTNSCTSLVERLRESSGNYKIEAVGNIPKTVRFRDMSDFQWNSSGNPLIANVRENLLSLNLNRIKAFHMSKETSSEQESEFVRPPYFTNTFIPHVYGYNQNINMRTEMVDGETHLMNLRRRMFSSGPPVVGWSCETVPRGPGRNLPAVENDELKECIQRIRKLFEERPLWTRRALRNMLPSNMHVYLKQALPHVAYFWKAGPWRDVCAKFGVDPRKSVDYAIYQVAAFKLDFLEPQETPENEMSHIFDGKKFWNDGKVYQFCDITDPLLASLISQEGQEMREEVDMHDGWYLKTRIFKIKSVLREKIKIIHAGKVPDDSQFNDLIGRPENADGMLDCPELALERQKQAEENDEEMEIEGEGEGEGEDYAGANELGPTADPDNGAVVEAGEVHDKLILDVETTLGNTAAAEQGTNPVESREARDGAAGRTSSNEKDGAVQTEEGHEERVKRLMDKFIQSSGRDLEEDDIGAADDFELLE